MERKETIKVSIVVPVYNVEKYLEQCALYTCLCLENYREAEPEERKQLRTIYKEMCAVQKKLYSSNAIRLADFSLELYCGLSAVKETLGRG